MSQPNKATDETPPYHDWAFLSHSHQDNLRRRGDGCGDRTALLHRQ